jgi:hypothetical protein
MTSSKSCESSMAPPRAQRKPVRRQTGDTKNIFLPLCLCWLDICQSAVAVRRVCLSRARPCQLVLTAPSQALRVPRAISELRTPTLTSPVRTSLLTVGCKPDRTTPALHANTAPHAVKSSRQVLWRQAADPRLRMMLSNAQHMFVAWHLLTSSILPMCLIAERSTFDAETSAWWILECVRCKVTSLTAQPRQGNLAAEGCIGRVLPDGE